MKHNLQLPVSKNQPVTIEASGHKTPDMVAVALFPRSPLTPMFLFFVRVRGEPGNEAMLAAEEKWLSLFSACILTKVCIRSTKLLNRTKNRTPSHVLSNNGLCQHSVHRACYHFFFSTGSIFSPILNFTELHALTLAAVLMHSCSNNGNMRYQCVRASFKIGMFVCLFFCLFVSLQQHHFTKVDHPLL